ncbi:hypothetical protein IV102_32310, partial [bacterium]|nr:hypothetical protein [bacterium]
IAEKGVEPLPLRPLDGLGGRSSFLEGSRRGERSDWRDAEGPSETRERAKESSKSAPESDKGHAPKEALEKEKKLEAKPPQAFRPAFQFRGGAKGGSAKQANSSSAADRAAAVKKISEQFQMSAGKFASQAGGEPKMPPLPGQSVAAREAAEPLSQATDKEGPARTSSAHSDRAEVKEADKATERGNLDRAGGARKAEAPVVEPQEKEDWTGIRRSSSFQQAKTEQEQRQQVTRREAPQAPAEGKSAPANSGAREEAAPQSPAAAARRENPPPSAAAPQPQERQENKPTTSSAQPARENEQPNSPQQSQRAASQQSQAQPQPQQTQPQAAPERPDKPAAPTREGDQGGQQQQQQQGGQRREQTSQQPTTQERNESRTSAGGSAGRDQEQSGHQQQNPRKEQGPEQQWQHREEGQRERGEQGQRRRQPQPQRPAEGDEAAEGSES